MNSRGFPRNEAIFAIPCSRVQENAKTGLFFRKVESFCQIDGFSCFFTKWGTFCNFYLKSSSKCKHMVVCSISCKVLAKSMIFRAFSRNEAFFATFSWKVHRNAKTWRFVRKLAQFWPNRWFFVLFHELSNFLQTFLQQFIETPKHGSLFEKVA